MDDFDPTHPHSCRCGRRWNGLSTCHCVTCHATFTGITGFDQHRRKGECVSPASVGLVDAGRPYSCWGSPRRNPKSEASNNARPTSTPRNG